MGPDPRPAAARRRPGRYLGLRATNHNHHAGAGQRQRSRAAHQPLLPAGRARFPRHAAAHTQTLDREHAEFGQDYSDHGLLFCWEDGRPPHPDTITRRFHKLAEAAGLPKINLHDVRHSYATAGRDAKIDWKALSERIGHSDVAFIVKQYVQSDLEVDRQVANTLAELIIGGSLASVDVTDETRGSDLARQSGPIAR